MHAWRHCSLWCLGCTVRISGTGSLNAKLICCNTAFYPRDHIPAHTGDSAIDVCTPDGIELLSQGHVFMARCARRGIQDSVRSCIFITQKDEIKQDPKTKQASYLEASKFTRMAQQHHHESLSVRSTYSKCTILFDCSSSLWHWCTQASVTLHLSLTVATCEVLTLPPQPPSFPNASPQSSL